MFKREGIIAIFISIVVNAEHRSKQKEHRLSQKHNGFFSFNAEIHGEYMVNFWACAHPTPLTFMSFPESCCPEGVGRSGKNGASSIVYFLCIL